MRGLTKGAAGRLKLLFHYLSRKDVRERVRIVELIKHCIIPRCENIAPRFSERKYEDDQYIYYSIKGFKDLFSYSKELPYHNFAQVISEGFLKYHWHYYEIPQTKIEKGDVVVDGPTCINGELAIGTNLRAALMFYEGYNYEDAVVISERVVRDDLLTSIHIREHKVEVRDTELGPEVITADIPHVNDRILQKLDMAGIVREGMKVKAGDILVGVIAPRGEKELTAEERLLRAIFGESASDVRDNSLRLPHGEEGIVIHTQRLSIEKGDKFPPGVLEEVKIWVADTKKLGYGDKISGRHGDKNTVAAIRPIEDMPFTEDGEPVDLVLTPTFLKRMNMGQAQEIHYGRYAKELGEKLAFPIFEGKNDEWLKAELKSS